MGRRTFTVAAADAGASLAGFVADRLGVAEAEARNLVVAGGVYVGRTRVRDPGRQVAAGDRIAVFTGDAAADAGDPVVPTVASGDDWLVVCKPPGLASQPARDRDRSVETVVRRERPDARVVHRLDRAAHGLLLLAEGHPAHARFRGWLDAGELVRRYRALVSGHVAGEGRTVDAPIGPDAADRRRQRVGVGRPAVTEVRVVERGTLDGRPCTAVELDLITGRRHQIRVHMASIGHPVVGDPLYVQGVEPRGSAPGLALACAELSWPGQRVQLDTEQHFRKLNFPQLVPS